MNGYCIIFQVRPVVAKWRVNTIRHYDLMVELWVAGRATGSVVRTSQKTCRQWQGSYVQVDLNENMEYIPEEPIYPGFTFPFPQSPPIMDEYSSGQT